MTELEHYIKQKDVETIGNVCSIARTIKTKDEDYCENHNCGECDFYKNKDEILKILLSEHKEKPQLTDDEKVILRNIDNTFKYIAKDENGELFVFEKKPIKKDSYWDCEVLNNCINLSIFTKLFKSIKWEDEEPWKISDLLED